jgi:hypothetical protein
MYMASLVESVAPTFGEKLRVEKVVTKTLAGATRYSQISKKLGRPAPVPSIWVDGELIFEMTPAQEDLQEFIEKRLQSMG